MKIKHQDIEIDPLMPFAKCKLGRAKYADVLTNIVRTYADGFVLAINNEWGAGKTTFVKMWQQDLIRYEFQTIYFNAWENDFDSNALVAIMSELKSLVNPRNEKVFKTVLQKGAILAKNILPAVAKAAAKKYVGVENVEELIEGATKGATEVFEKEIEEFASKKKTILEFRAALEKYIEKSGRGEKTEESEAAPKQKPIVFFIDELDRCRPSYSVEVLEQLKHLFSVPGIVFVLSIDKEQLANAVRGYYGSDRLNADEYLRRFIDLEYAIPKPSNKDFCAYLYDYYGFEDFFGEPTRVSNRDVKSEGALLLKMAEILFDKANATLRQQERVFGLTKVVLGSFSIRHYTFSQILFILTFIKVAKSALFKRIEEKSISVELLVEEFVNLVPKDVSIYYINLEYTLGILLHFYNNELVRYKVDLVRKSEDGTLSFSFPIPPGLFLSSELLARILTNLESESHYSSTKLSYLINKINLTEPLQIT